MVRELEFAFCVCALLCTAVSPVKSADQPTSALKNVALVVYQVVAENKGPCAIDLGAWNTAIDFVANQSTKLKLIKWREHLERSEDLSDIVKEASRKYTAILLSDQKADAAKADAAVKALDQAVENSSRHNFAPKFTFVAETMEHNAICFVELSAYVTATLKPSQMISTGRDIHFPSLEIWTTSNLLVRSLENGALAVDNFPRRNFPFVANPNPPLDSSPLLDFSTRAV